MDTTPAWYTSTQGPELSITLKALSGLILPVIMQLFNIQIGSELISNLIDASLIVIFGALAVYGHLRAKNTLQATVAAQANLLNTQPFQSQ